MKLDPISQKRKNRLVQTNWAKEFRKLYKKYWYQYCINYIAQNKRFYRDSYGILCLLDNEDKPYLNSSRDLTWYSDDELRKIGFNIVSKNPIIRFLKFVWERIKP